MPEKQGKSSWLHANHIQAQAGQMWARQPQRRGTGEQHREAQARSVCGALARSTLQGDGMRTESEVSCDRRTQKT